MNKIKIQIKGNSYKIKGNDNITRNGIETWKDINTIISTYIKFNKICTINLSLLCKIEKEFSIISVNYKNKSYQVKITNKDFDIVNVGKFEINEIGYCKIDFQGISKQGNNFLDLTDINIEGELDEKDIVYFKGDDTYWIRRGPSVHLWWSLPSEPIEYFYNEITVEEGNDINGSYYEANGCNGAYFGMQCDDNGRRFLFSVWSSYKTDDPKAVPLDYKVKLIKSGKDVIIGEFGNEGVGGQSRLPYNWKVNYTYKFLLRVKPERDSTIYTAYVYLGDKNEWRLVASFLRPKTVTNYVGAYSFSENYSDNQGYKERKCLFSNQWAITTNGLWKEVTKCSFTCNDSIRTDRSGGIEGNCFYLKHLGYKNYSTQKNSVFERYATGVKPNINLEELEKLM